MRILPYSREWMCNFPQAPIYPATGFIIWLISICPHSSATTYHYGKFQARI